MNKNMLFETLKELIDNQETAKRKDNQETAKRKEASYIYLDEKDNQIKEIPLSRLDPNSSAGAYIDNYNYKNPLKLIHDSIFG